MQGKYMLRSTKYSALYGILRLQTSLGQQNPRLAHADSCTGRGTDAPRCPHICLYRRKTPLPHTLGSKTHGSPALFHAPSAVQMPRDAPISACTGEKTPLPHTLGSKTHGSPALFHAPGAVQMPRDAPDLPVQAKKRLCRSPCAAKPTARPPFFIRRARYRCPAAPASCPNSM